MIVPGDYVYWIPKFNSGSGEKEIELKPGATLDLGTININKRLAEPKLMMQPTAPNQPLPPKVEPGEKTGARKDSKEPAAKDGVDRLISGTVNDESGNPVAGADVFFNTWNYQTSSSTVLAQGTSDANGQFELLIEQATLDKNLPPKNSKIHAGIVVKATGFAIDMTHWKTVNRSNGYTEPLVFSLKPQHLVVGKVVDLEGKAVVGAKVIVSSSTALGRTGADQFIETLNDSRSFGSAYKVVRETGAKTVTALSGGIGPWVKTDNNGHFQIEGLAAHALVNLRFEHPQNVTQLVALMTRDMKTNDADSKYRLLGDRPTVILDSSRPIVGKVVDSRTGDPIPGAMIHCRRMGTPGTVYASSAAPRTFSDEDGKFRLLGVPKSLGTKLIVYPPKDQPYLIKEIDSVPDTTGLDPANMTIKLHRGIWVSGQVTDQQTGEGVEAEIVYLPMKDNPNLEGVEGYQSGRSLDRYSFFGHNKTDANGHYRLAGLPGRAIVQAKPRNAIYRPSAGSTRHLNNSARSTRNSELKMRRKLAAICEEENTWTLTLANSHSTHSTAAPVAVT